MHAEQAAIYEQFAAMQEAFEATMCRLRKTQERYQRQPTADYFAECLVLTKELSGICADARKYVDRVNRDGK